MKCNRCDSDDAARRELQYPSAATVVVYLCGRCTESAIEDDGVEPLLPAT